MTAGVVLARPGGPGAPEADAGRARLREALEDAALAVDEVSLGPGGDAAGAPVVAAVERHASEGRWPVAVVAEGAACDAAVLAAASSPDVRALALLSPALEASTVALLAEWPEVPVLAVADSRDRSALGCAVDVYLGSSHPDTGLDVQEGIGGSAEMVAAWHPAPGQPALDARLAAWTSSALASVGRSEQVSFETGDGWRIHGDLVVGASEGAPGVVLLHSGRSDRTIFTRLSRLLARAGFVVLNVDWRGRGRSVNRGTYFELSSEEKAAAGNDAAAALDLLASRPEVDDQRLALVGVVHGAEYAVRGAVGDDRVRALALLTGYRPADDAERDFLLGGSVEVFYVTCEAHGPVTQAMRELYEASPGRRTRLVVYPGGAIGYQLFETDPALEPTVVQWLAEVVGRGERSP